MKFMNKQNRVRRLFTLFAVAALLTGAFYPLGAPALLAQSQARRCATKHVNDAEARGVADDLSRFDAERLRAAQNREPQATLSSLQRNPGSVNINVYFHVINRGSGLSNGDVPLSMIQSQIDVLNRAFAGRSHPSAAPTPFRFTLARVTRTNNSTWFGMTQGSSAERQAKERLRVGDVKELNIYTALTYVPPNDSLGWATFPWDYQTNRKLDGVVVDYRSLLGGALPRFNLGDTAVHEVGHWLGLFHTFERGCSTAGDYVSDTPAEASPAIGCPSGRDSCRSMPGLDPIRNFMDYTDDACMYAFTRGQVTRMDSMAARHRRL